MDEKLKGQSKYARQKHALREVVVSSVEVLERKNLAAFLGTGERRSNRGSFKGPAEKGRPVVDIQKTEKGRLVQAQERREGRGENNIREGSFSGADMF